MSIPTIEKEEKRSRELIELVDLSERYINIVGEYGPSEQLMKFVDYDNSFGESIGLEGFSDLSLSARNEILLLKLKDGSVGEMALESLANRIDKMSDWLIKGGSVGAIIGLIKTINTPFNHAPVAGLLIGGISIAAGIAGHIVRARNNHKHGTCSPQDFAKFQASFDTFVREELLAANTIPDPTNDAQWKAFITKVNNKRASEALTSVIEYITTTPQYKMKTVEKVELDGENVDRNIKHIGSWTESQFSSALKWLVSTGEKVHQIELAHAKKLETLDKWVVSQESARDVDSGRKMKEISQALSLTHESFKDCSHFLGFAKEELSRVGHTFEEKK